MQGSFVRKRGSTWTAYHYQPDLNGGRRQRSKGGFRTKAEAQEYLNTTVAAVQRGEFVEATKLSLGDYLTDRWLPVMRSQVRPSTWESYRRMIEIHVLPTLGHIPIQQLSADHLDRLYGDLLERGNLRRRKATDKDEPPEGLSPKTVRYLHNTLHKALKDAERKRLVVRNVASAADPPRLRQSGDKEMQTWTAAELRIFLAAMHGHRFEAAYILAATTGMRRGEVLGLRWRDISWKERRVAVRQAVTIVNYKIVYSTPKTARGRRAVAIDPSTLAALQAHMKTQAEHRALLGATYQDIDLVFADEHGGPINPDLFSQIFDRTVAKLPVPRIRLHDLRHTHATLGLAAGIPAKIMSTRLGHATVGFTQDVYMHAIPQLEDEAAGQVADLIFGTASSR